MSKAVNEHRAFLEPFAELERTLAGRGPEWLRRTRRAGLQRFEELGFPTTGEEEWRTTSVAPIARTRFRPGARVADPPPLPSLADHGPAASRLVFVDGRATPAGATAPALPGGVWIGSLAEALERCPSRLEEWMAAERSDGQGAFCALNTALAEDGGVVLVEEGVELPEPVHLVYVSRGAEQPTASHPRTLIVAGASSRVRVVESYLGHGDGIYLTNAVTDVILHRNASVQRYRVQAESERAYHISTTRGRLGKDSRYLDHSVDLGGRLVRNELRATLRGNGCDCDLVGLYQVTGEQQVDNQTGIDHAEPHCTSREVYKGVLAGGSRATFNGRIIVRPGAQATDSRQSNSNLLLSDRALAHTRPQLEIYADDVKCTHGATVGRLDEDAVFYLCSRGIAEDEARHLLISAFADEVLDRIEIESLRDRLKRIVAGRLPVRIGRDS